jgi:hypothetical protein
VAVGVNVGVGVGCRVGVGVGLPFAKRCCAGINPTIGVKSGPIGGHGRLPHHAGGPLKYKLFGIV